MNKEFWTTYYKDNKETEPSTFAQYVLPLVKGTLVDIGCGDGRDLYYFIKNEVSAHGVDASNEDVSIIRQNIMTYIKQNPSPDNVYARFFWHAIEREEQLAILDWCQGTIFIEARTKKDKPKNVIGKHKRNLVDTEKLKKDLEERGYEIEKFVERDGLSPYKGEDPHLVRVIAKRMV